MSPLPQVSLLYFWDSSSNQKSKHDAHTIVVFLRASRFFSLSYFFQFGKQMTTDGERFLCFGKATLADGPSERRLASAMWARTNSTKKDA